MSQFDSVADDYPSRVALEEMVKTTPPSGKRRSIGWVAGIACLGSFLFGYDTGVISGALPYMQMPWDAGGMHLSSLEEGLIGGVLLIGAAFGALFGGRLSDRYGRRHNILLLAILFFIGAILVAGAPNLAFMYISRFILGLAVGGASATVPVYLAETAPKRIRGTIVAIDQLMIVVGQLAAFSFNAVINAVAGGPKLVIVEDPTGTLQAGEQLWSNVTSLENSFESHAAYRAFADQLVLESSNGDAWRYMLILCSIPAIALWLGMRLMPESPRWYSHNKRYIEGIGALKRVRDERDEPIADEVGEIVDLQIEQNRVRDGKFSDIWHTPWLRKLFLVGMLIAASNQLTGVNTVMYYAPKVLEYAGMTTQAAITAQVANGVMSVIGAAAGLVLIYKFRRRSILLFCIGGVSVCMFALSAMFGFFIQPHLDGGTTPSPFAAIAVLVIMGVFMLIVQSSNGPVVWTMLGEIFPGYIRGIANGACVFFLWMVNALVTVTFPPLIDNFGGLITYGIYGVMNVAMFIALWRWMPETVGLSMEEIEVAMEEKFS